MSYTGEDECVKNPLFIKFSKNSLKNLCFSDFCAIHSILLILFSKVFLIYLRLWHNYIISSSPFPLQTLSYTSPFSLSNSWSFFSSFKIHKVDQCFLNIKQWNAFNKTFNPISLLSVFIILLELFSLDVSEIILTHL